MVAKAIKTEGAVGWLIHRAIKSNYAKHRAALIAAENDAAKSVPGAGGDVGNRASGTSSGGAGGGERFQNSHVGSRQRCLSGDEHLK